MKDHAEQAGRRQLIESMVAGTSWQEAVAKSHLRVSRSTAYRLVKLARQEDTAALALQDGRQGHPSKLTAPVQKWIAEVCHSPQEMLSSQVKRELKSRIGVEASMSQINRVRAKLGVSNQWRGRAQGKKN
jgi:transposase